MRCTDDLTSERIGETEDENVLFVEPFQADIENYFISVALLLIQLSLVKKKCNYIKLHSIHEGKKNGREMRKIPIRTSALRKNNVHDL